MREDERVSTESSTIETDTAEPFDLATEDLAATDRSDLLRLFPEVATESGKIDFDQLRRTLGEMVDPGKERYGLIWPGKAGCFPTIQAPSLGTLRPVPTESINFDVSGNLIVEGDNLEVLKLLQKSYLGQVKMIFIDPPYNSGNDFIYPDDFTETLQTYLEYTGQTDRAGKKFSTNTEADGRFHSNWLNMMYPRLYLARNLLRDDGMIFVSIDDHELLNLRALMNEIFGEENFIDTIVWKKRYGGGAKERHLVTIHEYILMYGRDKSSVAELFVPLTPEAIKRYYKYTDDNFERWGPYRIHPLESMKSFEERKKLQFPIEAPDGTMVMPKRQWRWSPDRVQRAKKEGALEWLRDKQGGWTVYSKQYLRNDEQQRETKFFSIIDDVYTQDGTNEIIDLFGDAQVFSFPKPSKLIEKLITLSTETNDQDLVLDFFAGSGSTAHAVATLNAKDGGNRRFVLVQLPEPTGRSDFATISDITKERVRRVMKKLDHGDEGALPVGDTTPDRGFRVFKLDQSNFTSWAADVAHDAAALAKQLEMHVHHIRDVRSPEDILFELLLKSGFELGETIQERPVADMTVYSVANGALVICLERILTLDLVRAIAEMNPERVVMLDEGFAGNDQLKANAVQLFKTKGIPSFKTV